MKMNNLKNSISSTKNLLRKRLTDESYKLELANQKVHLTDPKNVLARGYSITTHNGRVLKDTALISIDDTIKTTLFGGILISKVLEKDKTDNPQEDCK